MKTRSLARWFARLGVVALLVPGSASAAEVQVMISAGFYGVYAELGPAFERASGHRLITTRGPSMGDSPEAIPTRLARGETADVVILDGGSADELAQRGLVRAGSKVDLARSQIGMVVRAGAAKPNIGSVEAFRRTLLAVKSIGYSDSGSGTYLSTIAVREARRRGPGGRQESQGTRATVRRTSGRGRRAWRGGNRLSAGQRAHTRPWCDLRRGDSGRAPARIFVRRSDHQCSPAAGRGARAAPLPRIARGGLDDLEGRADTTTCRAVVRARRD